MSAATLCWQVKLHPKGDFLCCFCLNSWGGAWVSAASHQGASKTRPIFARQPLDKFLLAELSLHKMQHVHKTRSSWR